MSDPTSADPLLPVSATAGVKGDVTRVELGRRERTVARRSAETRATVPSVELMTEVDMQRCLARSSATRCATMAAVLSAVGRALRQAPRVNGAYRDGRYELYSRVNIGVTFEQEGAPVIATLFDADAKATLAIDAELTDLGQRAADGSLSAAEVSGATFTVTGSPERGAFILTPLIQPPQAAALAVGPVREAPVIRDGAVVAGHTMRLALACDQRIVPGAQAAAFLEAVKDDLEHAAL